MKSETPSIRTLQSKILALDIGSKRMGLALWNPGAQLGSVLPTLERKNLRADLESIKNLVTAQGVEAFLVGMPLGLDGKMTKSAETSEFWIGQLKQNFQLPIFTFDEGLSTKEAVKTMAHQRKKKRESMKDGFAALMILEDFIRECREYSE